MKLKISTFAIYLLTMFGVVQMLPAQPIYNMSNLVVDDCEGILLDSENGDVAGTYDHNEDYTFSICIPGVDEITLEFQAFCTEENFDFLTFYNGPDTLSPQIGPSYHGDVDIPDITATNGCLTIHFITDPNVTCTGWYAEWSIEVTEPVPPNILPIPDLPCESNSLSITFDEQIPCDSIYPAAFEITGPQTPSIISPTSSPCNGTTDMVDLVFDPPITQSGNYRVRYTSYAYDECGRLYVLQSDGFFQVVDCPLSVTLTAEDSTLCAGTCTFLNAVAEGGDPNTYSYSWTPDQSDSSRLVICPTLPTTYSVTVTDAQGATASDMITITPLPLPVIDNGDLSVCQSDPVFALTANPPGGEWSGLGIEEAATLSGWYDPSLVGQDRDTVTYTDTDGCSSQIIVSITPLDVGTDDAACPNTAAFFVSGGLPAGGTWSGPHIQADGLFDPTTEGSFEVSYTHPNGCVGSKMVNVGNIVFPVIDTLCQSAESFEIAVTPFGGEWSGPGIEDAETGRFNPEEVDPGTIVLNYTINGCTDSMEIFIKEIYGGNDFSTCPDEAPFQVPGDWNPQGGTWFGTGITDASTGLYDPSNLPDGFRDSLSYVVNGCAASRIVYVIQTEIGVTETLQFCLGEEAFELSDDNVDIRPRRGTWQGNGVVQSADEDWFFDPSVAGTGIHSLVFTANTCSDTLMVAVHPTPIIAPLSICEAAGPVSLSVAPAGGLWSGTGISNVEAGIFDPSIAGVGTHTVYNEQNGCVGEREIIVFAFEEASIENLAAQYCYQDIELVPTVNPVGGTLTVDGIPVTTFNPVAAGPGTHIVKYEVGTGACFTEATMIVEVGSPIDLTMAFEQDSICSGTGITIAAEASGGRPFANFSYTWNQGLGFGQSHFILPTSTKTYTVTVSDGCSVDQVGDLTVWVHPSIQTSYFTGEAVCFDDSTFATIEAVSPGDYSFVWDTEPPTEGNTLISYPTNYVVTVTNDSTECSVERTVELPGYNLIKANFGLTPNVECISSLHPDIEILDFSVGATTGYWDFGDGKRVPYEFGEDLSHSYADTGNYVITLSIENEGACPSEFQRVICVKPEHRLFAPNALTPNYDGKNDFFKFVGVGINKIDWQIYDRWGQLLFEGHSMDDEWDAHFKGNKVKPGVYTYIAKYSADGNPKEAVLQGLVTVVY